MCVFFNENELLDFQTEAVLAECELSGMRSSTSGSETSAGEAVKAGMPSLGSGWRVAPCGGVQVPQSLVQE